MMNDRSIRGKVAAVGLGELLRTLPVGRHVGRVDGQ